MAVILLLYSSGVKRVLPTGLCRGLSAWLGGIPAGRGLTSLAGPVALVFPHVVIYSYTFYL